MNTPYQQNAISAYNKAVTNAPQASTIVVFYDGVMRHLSAARIAFETGKHADMLRLINKANCILFELQRALRSDLSQALFEQLDLFYGTAMINISRLPNKKFDDAYFRSLLSAVRTVRNAWAEVAGMTITSGKLPDSDHQGLRIMG